MRPDALNWLSSAIEKAVDVAVYPLLLILALAVLLLVIDAARHYMRDRVHVGRAPKSRSGRRPGESARATA